MDVDVYIQGIVTIYLNKINCDSYVYIIPYITWKITYKLYSIPQYMLEYMPIREIILMHLQYDATEITIHTSQNHDILNSCAVFMHAILIFHPLLIKSLSPDFLFS